LAVCLQLESLPSMRAGDARGAIAIERHAMGECIDHDREILSSQCWAEIGVRSAAAAAVPTSRLPSTDAFLLCPVVVGRAHIASSYARIGESITNRVGVPILLNIQWPIDAAVLVSSALPVFQPLEVWKHIVKRPTR